GSQPMVMSPSAANIATPHRHNGKAEAATPRFINTRLALRIVEAMRPLPVHLFFALNPQLSTRFALHGVLPFTTALALWHWRPPRDRPPLWIHDGSVFSSTTSPGPRNRIAVSNHSRAFGPPTLSDIPRT